MVHVVKIEALQENGRTLEISPAGGIRTSAPLLPSGAILEFGAQEYVVVAVRQALYGWQGDDWGAITTYLVDEAVEDENELLEGPDGVPHLADLVQINSRLPEAS